jgi:outer membrane cobalamin receptor
LGVPGNVNWGISNEKNYTNTVLYSPQIEYKLSETDTLKLLYTYSENTLESLDGYNEGLYDERVNSLDFSFEHSASGNTFHQLFGYSIDARNFDRAGVGEGSVNYDYKYKANAIFSQSAFRINDSNTVKLGARYSNYNHSYEDGWTGNFQYLHKLNNFDDVRLFFKASKGTSPPELSILKSDWEDILSDNYGLEKIRSLEIGMKQSLVSKAELGLIYFVNHIENIADSAYDQEVLSYSSVDTKQKGIEAYFQSPMDQAFTYNLSYTYLDAIVEDSVDDKIYFNSDIGAQLIRRPVHKLLAGMQLKFNPQSSVGAQFMCAIDREDKSGKRFEDIRVLRLFGNYDLDDQWRIYWRIENALNEDYEWTSGYAGSPPTYNIGTQFKF